MVTSMVAALPCPPDGAKINLTLQPAADAAPSTALIFGTVDTPSCDGPRAPLGDGYAVRLACNPAAPATCRTTVSGLLPGQWIHRVLVIDGEAAGQFQGRVALALDASAGTPTVAWPLYRSVHLVEQLVDALDCTHCLRSAIADAALGAKPALIEFAPDLAGSVVLAAALPPLSAGPVTIDAFNTDGRPHTRTLDGNGLDAAALKITSAGNRVQGLRVINTGGDSDTVLIDGPEANGNRLESLEAIGRTLEVCGSDGSGCIVDGECHVGDLQFPRGVCGDDVIAVRNFAGAADPNIIEACTIRGARDKGVKVSDGGAARVERSVVTNNADGGLQATLSGQLAAVENLVSANQGTNSASGLAANGASADGMQPARLETHGNLSIGNALRGISVRSLSIATLRDDFVCGNGTAGRGNGFGLAVHDAAGRSGLVTASGLAVVHNVDGGVVVADTSAATFGSGEVPGRNAFAFNGPLEPPFPTNVRNQTGQTIAAAGNYWEHCGNRIPCNTVAVQFLDVTAANPAASVDVRPPQATPIREPPQITAIEPPFAAAGELVRLYGTGFDAINGNGSAATCATIAGANGCRPVRGNCVFIDRQPAEVVAATPTMLVVRSPFTCVAPVLVQARTRWSHGFGRATFCTVPAAAD